MCRAEKQRKTLNQKGPKVLSATKKIQPGTLQDFSTRRMKRRYYQLLEKETNKAIKKKKPKTKTKLAINK